MNFDAHTIDLRRCTTGQCEYVYEPLGRIIIGLGCISVDTYSSFESNS